MRSVVGLLLIVAYVFVSYRTISSIRRSRASGLFRTVGSAPLGYLLLFVGASPLLILERIWCLLPISRRKRDLLERAEYVGNRESLVFHRRGCEYRDVMAHNKRVAFATLEDATSRGFRPCAACKPLVND